jgi:hypothetical protein
MWSTEYTGKTHAPAEAVWAALRDLHSGVRLSARSDAFELLGPFQAGTEILVTPQGQDTLRSVITELEAPRVYADQTSLNGLTLTFRHVLDSLPDGGTRVTHQLSIDGPAADAAGPELGPQISEDFPVAMADLLAAAEKLEYPRRS